MIRSTTVILYERTQTGTDAFNAPVFAETPVPVPGVLIGQPSTDEITEATDLYGKKLECWLAIPKKDRHTWKDRRVDWTDAYGRTVQLMTFGEPITGIEANVPTRWHMKVRCACYE